MVTRLLFLIQQFCSKRLRRRIWGNYYRDLTRAADCYANAKVGLDGESVPPYAYERLVEDAKEKRVSELRSMGLPQEKP